MRLSTILSLGMMLAGGAASLRTLNDRQSVRDRDRTVQIVVDYTDAQAVSIRAGLPLAELFAKLKASGATDIALPELTLHGLLRSGAIFQTAPREPLREPAPFGHWNYLAGADDRLLQHLLQEVQARLPHIKAQPVRAERNVIAFAGDLLTLGQIGLGFDAQAASEIHGAGLRVVPRPVSYDWHEPELIARTLAQAAQAGDGTVAFEGDLILGHEMHLNDTLAALERHGLAFAYFAESRHQRGDWFIAKRRMPQVVIAHQFSPAQMIPEDYHSISHRWANLARERGVRMFFVNFFRVVHANEPMECLEYLEHVRGAVEHEGFVLSDGRAGAATLLVTRQGLPALPQRPDSNRTRTVLNLAPGIVPVGAGALAARELLDLNDGTALLLATAGTIALAGMGRLDRARDELEKQYAPVYASKALALGATILAPLAAALLSQRIGNALEAIVLDGIVSATSAAALAALTSSDEYRLRVEEYKGFDLDVWLPLAIVLFAQPGLSIRLRLAAVAAVAAGWQFTRRVAPDPFARFDGAPAEHHTHHLSAAMRLAGDMLLKVGLRPVRKWSGLAPFALALYVPARRRGYGVLATVLLAASLGGHAAMLSGFRRPERDPRITARGAARSWVLGALTGAPLARLIGSLPANH